MFRNDRPYLSAQVHDGSHELGNLLRIDRLHEQPLTFGCEAPQPGDGLPPSLSEARDEKPDVLLAADQLAERPRCNGLSHVYDRHTVSTPAPPPLGGGC